MFTTLCLSKIRLLEKSLNCMEDWSCSNQGARLLEKLDNSISCCKGFNQGARSFEKPLREIFD